ncbi:MAG TPA: HlyD family secretion protein [Gemmataceae bacterium]|nr:HlyD family secretion protein [Gemmataceae bacterium]
MEKKVPGTHEETDGSRPAASTSPPGLPNQSANAVDQHAHVPDAHSSVERAHPPEPSRKAPSWRTWAMISAAIIGLAMGARFLVPWVTTALNTVSTDDAYVNGHVTFVAPRVAGQVSKVLVDDNYRVKRGDLLVQLDKEPFQVQVAIKQAALTAAETDLTAAKAQVQALVAQTRASKFKLEHAIEDVRNQVANLRANVAILTSKQASLELSRANLKRGKDLAPTGGISKEDLDQRQQQVKVDEAAVEQALQNVYANRVGLGLPEKPPQGQELSDAPPDLDQNFSTVRQALAALIQNAAQLGYFPTSWSATPKEVVEAFYKRDPEGNLDRIYAQIIPNVPLLKQAEAKVLQARRDLDQAELNLRYCDVVSEIDGVVTSRNVNPGNNVQVGQNLMAVRSLTEIWIDANFKETQLADLRIGQRVRCEVDMYGSRREYEGRITGFTMGTGQTLSLLPPQNATGNYVKIVQRLPVRIELTDYDPDKEPLFYGLSVEPYVYYKEPPTGPNAGAVLQPLASLPKGSTDPKP